jgi:hypothetical protein
MDSKFALHVRVNQLIRKCRMFGKRLGVILTYVESRGKPIVTVRILRLGRVQQISVFADLPLLLLKLQSDPYTVGTPCYLRGQGTPHSSDTLGIPVN